MGIARAVLHGVGVGVDGNVDFRHPHSRHGGIIGPGRISPGCYLSSLK